MTMHRLAAAAWLALAGGNSLAMQEAMPSTATGILLDVQALYGTYLARERIGGVVLNEDSGDLSGGALALTATWEPMTWRLSARSLQGGIAYRGFTQLGLPLQTQTDLRWLHLHGWVGSTHRMQTTVGSFGIAAGAGQLMVKRAIRATARSLPVTETLRLQLVSAGGDWRLPLSRGGLLHGQLRWHHAFARSLAVDTGTVLDPYDLEPRNGNWASIGAGLQWPLAAGVNLTVSLEHDALRVAAAPARVVYRQGQLAGFSSYPGSRQRLQTIGIGLLLEL